MAGFTAEQVEEVRMVVRMFPIFLTTIFYWTIYSQVGPLHLRVPLRLCPPCNSTLLFKTSGIDQASSTSLLLLSPELDL